MIEVDVLCPQDVVALNVHVIGEDDRDDVLVKLEDVVWVVDQVNVVDKNEKQRIGRFHNALTFFLN